MFSISKTACFTDRVITINVIIMIIMKVIIVVRIIVTIVMIIVIMTGTCGGMRGHVKYAVLLMFST